MSKQTTLPSSLEMRKGVKGDRDLRRTIVCPVLLQTQCEVCFSFGHTRSYCTASPPFQLHQYKKKEWISTQPNIFLNPSKKEVVNLSENVFLPSTPSCSPPPSDGEESFDVQDVDAENGINGFMVGSTT
jgi:hypothetical protein